MMRKALIAAGVVAALGAAALAQTRPPAAPAAPVPPPAPSDFRDVDPQNVLVIDTTKGRVLVELVPQLAPNHVARVRGLARQGFYDGLTFFRVVDDFMAQTGDPQNSGEGGSDLPDMAAEFTFRRGADDWVSAADPGATEAGFVGPVPVMSQSSLLMAMTNDGKVNAWGLYCPGVAGMARAAAPDSANSQFFLMREAYPSLDKNYSAFGRVISGLEAVRQLKTGEPVAEPRDRMERVRVLADIPESARPKVRVIDPHSAWFKARLQAAGGVRAALCDIPIPTEVK